jgi:hypothetical protein
MESTYVIAANPARPHHLSATAPGTSQICLAWPTEIVGAYGHGDRNALDAALDQFVADSVISDSPVLRVAGVIAGRNRKLVPVVVVRLQGGGAQ